MSKIFIYTVVLEFDDEIVDEAHLGENLLESLVSQANGAVLAPEDSDTFTTRIAVAKDGVEIASKTF